MTSDILERVGTGTVARAAIEYLMRRPAGTELTTVVLAEAIGQLSSGLGSSLRPAVRQRFLSTRQANGRVLWSLGPAITDAGLYEPADITDADRSVVRLDAAAMPSVFAYARSRGAAPFSVSLSTDGRLTAERYGRVFAEFTDEERRILILAGAQGVAPK